MARRIVILAAVAACSVLPAFAQSLPPELVGAWDVSAEACAAPGLSVTQIDLSPDRIDTYGGNALVREVETIGASTFVAGDFEQTEGAAEIAPRSRQYFRLFRAEGPDRMRLVWKDVQTVGLFRCAAIKANDAAE